MFLRSRFTRSLPLAAVSLCLLSPFASHALLPSLSASAELREIVGPRARAETASLDGDGAPRFVSDPKLAPLGGPVLSPVAPSARDANALAESSPALRRLRDQVRLLTAAHGGKWSYDFTFVRNDGTSERLSGENRDTGAIPASTLKVIPAWVAFRDKLVTNRFLARMLKKSDNHMANGLTRLLGGPQRLEETLHADPELRVAGGSFRLVDGSGLSTANRVTAASEVLFLRSILASRDHYDVFKTLLARPGEFGTLRGRFAPLRARERLFAKTGTLPDAGVASLAGFLETERGVVVFSIIGNDLNETARGRRGRPRKVRRFRLGRQTIDRIVGLHAAYAG